MALDKKELGKLIKRARKIKSEKLNKKYTGQDLANELEISRSYLGDIEAGRSYPNYRLLSKIANICEVPLSFFGDIDQLLLEIIMKNFTFMSIDEVKDFAYYIKTSVNSPYGVIEWDLNTWKAAYDDYRKNSILSSYNVNESKEEYCGDEKKNITKNDIDFSTPQEAMKFILEQPAIMGFGGFDVNKMSNDEIMDFANELLNQLKLLGYKYKK